MITTASSRIEQFENNFQKHTDFLSQKIKAEYHSDKTVNINNFYCFGDKNIMLMGENLSVCGHLTEEDAEELMSFCQFLGVYGLECGQNNLSFGEKNTMYLMKYSGAECCSCEDIIKNENIYQFSQFSCSNFEGISFNTVYSYFARKVTRGISDIYYLEHNGKIVSGALATHFDNEIYLTFVSTAKNFRNQGLAKKIIKHIISVTDQKDIILMCEKELVPFYTKIGFEITKETYLYKLRTEHI